VSYRRSGRGEGRVMDGSLSRRVVSYVNHNVARVEHSSLSYISHYNIQANIRVRLVDYHGMDVPQREREYVCYFVNN
jgi:hypothetical protein